MNPPLVLRSERGEIKILHKGEAFVVAVVGEIGDHGEVEIDHEAAWRILSFLEAELYCAP